MLLKRQLKICNCRKFIITNTASSPKNLNLPDIPNIFAGKYNIKEYLMLMVGTNLRIGSLKGHILEGNSQKHYF